MSVELRCIYPNGAVEIAVLVFVAIAVTAAVFPFARRGGLRVPAVGFRVFSSVFFGVGRRHRRARLPLRFFDQIAQFGVDVIVGKSVVLCLRVSALFFRGSVIRTAVGGSGNRLFFRREIFLRRKLHNLERADFRFGGNGNARRFACGLRAQNHLRESVVLAEAENGFDGIGDDFRMDAALRCRGEARGGVGGSFVVLQKDVAGFYSGIPKFGEKRSREGARCGIGDGVERASGGRSRAGRDDDDVSASGNQRRKGEAHGAKRGNDLGIECEANFFRGNGLKIFFGKILPGEDDADEVFLLFQNGLNGGNDGVRRCGIAGNGNKFVLAERGFGNRSRERVNANADAAEAPSDAQGRLSACTGDDNGIHKTRIV